MNRRTLLGALFAPFIPTSISAASSFLESGSAQKMLVVPEMYEEVIDIEEIAKNSKALDQWSVVFGPTVTYSSEATLPFVSSILKQFITIERLS